MITQNTSDQFRVLLIEDNDDHAELTEFYLNESMDNVEIERLSDGHLALRHLQAVMSGEHPLPWLILLDLKLPKYDGHEILTFLKQNALLSTIPVVVFTTSDSSKDVSLALENHANSYITKPMQPDHYGLVIDEILKYWQLNQHTLANESDKGGHIPE